MKSEIHPLTKHSASFRFYEELNDFLLPEQRKQTFTYQFAGTPSVKDAVEAIGVPHTEVDLILVDGVSVDFNYLMQGGERVAVYPVFESLDISPIIHLRPEPLRDTRFVVDVNLGKLAQKLRLLGFDTYYRNDLHDSEIIDISLLEHRIILTRDIGVLRHKRVTHGYWVRSDDPSIQLKEVVQRLQLQNSFQPFTRCSICNGLVQEVVKEQVKDRLPEDTYRYYDHFLECQSCGKLYWKGSHYERILDLIDSLRQESVDV